MYFLCLWHCALTTDTPAFRACCACNGPKHVNQDLTGSPVRTFRLDGQLELGLIQSGEFWTMLERFDRLKSVWSCLPVCLLHAIVQQK
jgi:hypothetical protein